MAYSIPVLELVVLLEWISDPKVAHAQSSAHVCEDMPHNLLFERDVDLSLDLHVAL